MQRIGSLSGLKVIALILLFWWHSPIPNPHVDIGARACEFFFVVSGFLVSYNYSNKMMPATWKESCLYVKKKLSRMWPLHFVAFLICLFLMPISDIFTKKTVFEALINLSLLQSWSIDSSTFFSFNGTSWFLSSILFCYFLSPFLLKTVNTRQRAVISFIIAIGLRILIEKQQILFGSEITAWNLHVSPVIRGLEFYAGLALYPISLWFKDLLNGKHIRMISSLIEIIITLITLALVVVKEGHWMRAEFVIIFCIMIVVYSWDMGVISNVLSTYIFKLFERIEFEFFLLHQAIIKVVDHFSILANYGWKYQSIVSFVLVLITCYVWKRFFSDITKKWMDNILNRVQNIYCN